MKPSDFLKRNKNIKLLADQIPASSAFMKYDRSLRERVVQDLIADKSIKQILKELHNDGYKEITDQQLRRFKRNVTPVWLKKTEPRIVFTGKIEETLDTYEYLLDMQFKRIIECMEQEIEDQNLLTPSKYLDADAVPGLVKKLDSFYKGDIDEVKKNILFSVMERKGRNPFLFKEIQSYGKLITDYLSLRQALGDDSMKLKKGEKSATLIEIHGSDRERKELEKQTREKVLKAATDGKEKKT